MKVKSVQTEHRLDQYDVQADLVVMRNAELQKQLLDAVPYKRSDKFTFVDIGAGAGGTTHDMLARFPNASALVIDSSAVLLQKARRVLSKFGDRVTYLCMDVRQWSPEESSVDLVVSALTIHNLLPGDQAKLHATIDRALKVGGYFVNADFCKAEDEVEDARRLSVYRSFLESNLSGPALKTWLHHAFAEDEPMRLSEQSISLQKSGLSMPRVVWNFENEAVYIAHKPPGKRIFYAMPFYGKTHAQILNERETFHALAAKHGVTITEQFIGIEVEGRYCAHDYDPAWVVEKDAALIAVSDYVFVDFSAPSIGRDCEMVLARERFNKKIIAIVDDSSLQKHLWIRHYADAIVTSSDEAFRLASTH